jgi:hypothetical protein
MKFWITKKPTGYTSEELVEKWIDEAYGVAYPAEQAQARAVARYYFDNGEHGPNYGNNDIGVMQKSWSLFLGKFKQHEGEAAEEDIEKEF